MAFGSHYNTCHCIWIGCANFLQRDSVQRGRKFSLAGISVRISAKGKKRGWSNQKLKCVRNFHLLMENPTECKINS